MRRVARALRICVGNELRKVYGDGLKRAHSPEDCRVPLGSSLIGVAGSISAICQFYVHPQGSGRAGRPVHSPRSLIASFK
jgi:hypothetical protein